MLRVVLASMICSIALAACGDSGQAGADAGTPPGGLTQEQAARVVARVGDETITLGEYATALDRMDPYDRVRYQTSERKRELLKEMVDLELLAIEARRRGLDKKPVAQAAMRQILRDALLDETHKSLPTPTEIPIAEVREYYDTNMAEFREPERRRISAIVMADEEKAKEVLAALLKDPTPNAWGKAFFDNSLNAQEEKKKRVPLDLAGELGMVGPPDDPKGGHDHVPEPVRAAAYKIEKTGDVLPEVVSADGKFYIVRMSGRVPPHERTFAEAETQIRQYLLKKRLKEMDQNLEAELRKKYKVEIDETALSQVDVGTLPDQPATPLPSVRSAPASAPSVLAPSGAPSASAKPAP